MKLIGLTVIVVSVLLSGSGCSSECSREACAKLGFPAAGDGTSQVAGVIASETDVVENGCQECTYGSATLELWNASAPIDSETAAKSLIASSTPAATFQATARYAKPLTAGNYLLCTRPYCVAFEVKASLVTTVNLKLIYGPTRFLVFEAGSTTVRDVPAFQVGLP